MSDAESHAAAGAVPGIDEWCRLVEGTLGARDLASLTSATRDGIPIEPLYRRHQRASAVPSRNAGGWTIVQPVNDPDPDRANDQALGDLIGGATGLSIRFHDAASREGLPPTVEALRIALGGIDLAAIQVRLEPNEAGLRAAQWLADLVARSGVAAERADVSFGLDPVALLTESAQAAPDHGALAATFRALHEARFKGPFAVLDARVFHEAGASEAQELASVLAAAAWWLRALNAAGVAPGETIPFLGASLAVDRDLYVSIAKLRALRLLWARFQELCEVPQAPLSIHAETSYRMLTRADPNGNLLRTTLAAFAAATGGADSISVIPHTAALGPADRSARALARNIQHLLADEAHLDRVADPAAGSGAVESLTDALAEHAWTEFQAIEREGGIIESLRAGKFQERIGRSRDALRKEVASTRPLVGATIYQVAGEAAASAPAGDRPLIAGLQRIYLETLTQAAG